MAFVLPEESALPAASESMTEDLHEQVREVLELIRPSVQEDGGDVELVRISQSGVVEIRFHGACVGCPSSNMTLHMGIEKSIREKVPQVTAVIAVT